MLSIIEAKDNGGIVYRLKPDPEQTHQKYLIRIRPKAPGSGSASLQLQQDPHIAGRNNNKYGIPS